MRKLGIYIPVFEERPGGLGAYTREITRRLVDRVADVTLFTTTPDRVPKEWGVRVIGPEPRLGEGRLRLVKRLKWLNYDVRAAIKRDGIDALFVPSHEGMLVCPVAQTIVVHDLTMLMVPSSYFNPLLIAYMRLLLPIVAKQSTTIAVSENTRRDVLHHCRADADRVHVVYEGYDGAIFRPREVSEVTAVRMAHRLDRPYLLYGGTFAAHKNIPHVARVFAELRRRGHDILLAFTGRTDVGDFGETRRVLLEAGVWEATRCVGYVAREELSALMSGAVAFLFPSLYEGFGLAPLEAMASGAFVVSSDRASLPEVVGHGGVLLDPTDVAGWCDTIEAQIEQPDPVAKTRALASAARFSWDVAADMILRHMVSGEA